VLVDITERKKVEDRLTLYGEVFAKSHDGIAIIDLAGNYVEQNAAHATLTGFSDEDLVGQTPAIHLGEEMFAAIAEALQETGSYRGEVLSTGKSGRSLMVDLSAFAVKDENGDVCFYVGIKRDITERMAAERSMRESELKFRTLTSHAPAGIFLTDSGGRYLMVNERWLQYAGMPEEEALGEGWTSALHPDDRQRVLAEWDAFVKEGSEFSSEYRFQRPDKAVTWLRASASPLAEADGAIAGFIGTLTDITDLKDAEALKDQFLGLISHELRTPLSTIYGTSRLLRRRYDRLPDEDRIELMEGLISESDRLQRIIENLLLMTRLEASGIELEPVLLPMLIRQAVEAFQGRNPGREIDLTIDMAAPPVMGNQMYVELVIENLLSNANKYSEPGRRIEVALEARPAEAGVLVRDRGVGLSDDDLSRLFTPFFRSAATRNMASGTGIGLAVCKRVIEAQEGTIWAAARPGGGSEFGFALKAAPEEY
jgi:PAS domain S-box-containing protein